MSDNKYIIYGFDGKLVKSQDDDIKVHKASVNLKTFNWVSFTETLRKNKEDFLSRIKSDNNFRYIIYDENGTLVEDIPDTDESKPVDVFNKL